MYLPIFCRCGFLEAFHYSWPMKSSNFLIFLKTQYLHSPLHFETILYYMVHVLIISAAQDITSMHSSRMSTVRCSSRFLGGGGGCPGGGGYPSMHWAEGGGVYPSMHWTGGVYPSMHWTGGCLPGVAATTRTRHPSWTEFLTHASENITLPQLGWGP